MTPPIVYDTTHLVCRLCVRTPSGIDHVDLAYGRHFATAHQGAVFGVYSDLFSARPHSAVRFRDIVSHFEVGAWGGGAAAADPALSRVKQFLTSGSPSIGEGSTLPRARRATLGRFIERTRMQAAYSPGVKLPSDAIYLNIAQYHLEYPGHFSWLGRHPDIRPVFFVHDLLPLDYPEYFRNNYRQRFDRRIATIAQHAFALITSSETVRDRLQREMRLRGRDRIPIHAEPLPSPLRTGSQAATADPALAAVPYFVVVGTIEPRKNHLLLLNVWNDLIKAGGEPPKLIVVGGRGWENEQIADMLDRSIGIRRHILEVSGLSGAGLSQLLAHAKALLIPSFDEGYGLPVVDALTLETPVVASDIAIFREIGRDCAVYLDPIDGLGWRDAIVSLATQNSPLSLQARAKAAAFRAPSWQNYFANIETFLGNL